MTATALLLLVPLSAPPEVPDTINDQTVATWVADISSENRDKQRAAVEALMKAGPKAKSAVPALTKLLDPKDARAGYAIEILGAIGPDAKDAVPALLARLPKEGGLGYGVESVAHALAKIDGPKLEATRALLLSSGKCTPIFLLSSRTLFEYPAQVVPHIVALCRDQNAQVRLKAATVLAELKREVAEDKKTLYERAGDGAKGVPGVLEDLLRDSHVPVRMVAAQAIAQVAPQLNEKAIEVVLITVQCGKLSEKAGEFNAVPFFQTMPARAAKELIPLFDSEQERVRNWAVNTLTYIPVRDQLEAALKSSKKPRVREHAAITLGWRFSDHKESIPALKAALADGEFSVRFAAAKSLVIIGRGGDANPATVPVLVEGLQHNDEKVRLEASQNLLTVGAAAKTAVPTLKKLLDDKKPEVRLEAALALVAIDKQDAAGAVPVLIEGLKTGPDATATRAAKALGELGPAAKDAVPELVKKYDAKSPHLRLYAAEAVGRIDPAQAPKATEVLIALLKHEKYKSSMIRVYSLTALTRIGPAAKSALPTLAELLKDDEPFHADVALAMIALGPDGAKPAFDWMRRVLADPAPASDEDAYDLAERLPQLGKLVKPLVPDLVKLLTSKNTHFRQSAVETLAAIGPDAKEALPELKKLAESDPKPNIRKLAAEAIQKIEAK